ncbi:hypothetical protein NQZ79_g517 [Umbelopsis isabellina]|nr:hypothetical protein NQZ79_g517 [Umbelopsis isabellina]
MSQYSSKVELCGKDITKLKVGAIVNAANESLLGGGGGYNLPAKHVIHTVGPQTEDPKLLSSCYERSLKLAQDNKLDSIAFPCISTGVYGYDKTKAANVALQTTLDFFTQQEKQNDETVQKVIFCLFNPADKDIYKELLPQYFPGASTEMK